VHLCSQRDNDEMLAFAPRVKSSDDAIEQQRRVVNETEVILDAECTSPSAAAPSQQSPTIANVIIASSV